MHPELRFLPLQRPEGFLGYLIPQSMWRRRVEFLSEYAVYSSDILKGIVVEKQFNKGILYIPSSSVVNGSSWPFLLGWLFNPLGASFDAGTFHDFAYGYGFILIETNLGIQELPLTRDESDQLWKKLYIEANDPVNYVIFGKRVKFFRGVELSAFIGYWVLKAVGWIAWNRNLEGRQRKKYKLIANQLRNGNVYFKSKQSKQSK